MPDARADIDGKLRAAKPESLAEEVEARPPAFADEALALLFAKRHRSRLRYVATWGRWFEWDGARWKLEDTLHALDLARAICREASAACNDKAHVKRAIASAKTVAAVERLAKADRRHAATVDQWDADPWLLNTPGGTYDLRTGQRHDHRQENYCTKCTAVAPCGQCPRWLAFLDRITAGSAPLILFLQRMCGYFLTGTTREHALFFGHGTGNNGKSVFVNTVNSVMGDYANTAPMETFIASNNDRHPTELAGLRGARLVTSIETEQGRRWAESRIKTLTGGDKISARFMRQDFFEFVPQFKLLIVGNHKPQLRGVDEAIRRRMNLIPFNVAIPKSERDDTLPERLREEWPGILQWMLVGCEEWRRQGLAQPEPVRLATDEYLAAEDALALWIAEQLTIKVGAHALTRNLWASWKTWAEAAGEEPGTLKAFVAALQGHGIIRGDNEPGTNRSRFKDVQVRPPEPRDSRF